MTSSKAWIWYSVLVVLILILAFIGYIGYTLYPRFNLPPATGLSLSILAVSAAIASFFTPCSFPLLTTLLARSVHTDQRNKSLLRALRYGLALALGASAFLLLVGAGIALGGGTLFTQVTFVSAAGRILRVIVGGVLILLGIIQLGYLVFPFDKFTSVVTPIRKLQIRIRDEHPMGGFFLFGFAYILTGFG